MATNRPMIEIKNKSVNRLLTILSSSSPTYVVGGAVRDLLVGRVPHDYDLTTEALPDVVIDLLQKHKIKTVPTGLKFGTVTAMTLDPVEITTCRTDGRYNDFRRPSTVCFGTIDDDLARRDFTINAMALTPDGSLLDPHGGYDDLLAGVLRSVGDPLLRMSEDPLRMWRAVRFISEGKALTLDPSLERAISANRYLTGKLSSERVRDEISKILLSSDPRIGLNLARKTGLLDIAVAEWAGVEQFRGDFQNSEQPLADHLVETASKLDPILPLRLAGLLHDIGVPACFYESEGSCNGHDLISEKITEALLFRLRFPSSIVDHATELVRYHEFDFEAATPADLRRLKITVGIESMNHLRLLHIADRGQNLSLSAQKLFDEAVAYTSEDLAIDGDDIMVTLGLPPGPEVGRLLGLCTDAVLADPSANTRENLLRLVETTREASL